MPRLNKHIWLCGFMGCGKSTCGLSLARSLGVDFIDMDYYIESHAGKTIPEIFEKFGEEKFREIEAAVITKLNAHAPAVIATGGGAMISHKNASEAHKNGRIVFLDIPFETCYQRIAVSDRPIVKRSTKEELQELYKTRRMLYRKHSDIILEKVMSPIDTAKELQKLLAISN